MRTSLSKALLLTFIMLTAGCAERRVSYIPVYSPQPVYYVQPAPVVVAGPPAAAGTQVIVPEAEIVSPTSPPPPLGETVPAAPGVNYVWVAGHWTWNGKWAWVGGRWFVRPYPTAVWRVGHWSRRGNVYVWVPGHWR